MNPPEFITCLHCGNKNLRVHRALRKFCNVRCRVNYARKQKIEAAKNPAARYRQALERVRATQERLTYLQEKAESLKPKTLTQ